jgi:putative flippase GtrA
MAWIIAFCISFPIGFTLSRYVVFPESNLRGRIQFFRYALTTVTFILMNYLLIKFFATYLPGIWPTVSYAFVNIIIAVMSYISQRKFTFKTTVIESIEDEVVVPD